MAYRLVPLRQTTGKNLKKKRHFRYLEMTVTIQNCIHEESERNSWGIMPYSIVFHGLHLMSVYYFGFVRFPSSYVAFILMILVLGRLPVSQYMSSHICKGCCYLDFIL